MKVRPALPSRGAARLEALRTDSRPESPSATRTQVRAVVALALGGGLWDGQLELSPRPGG